MSTEATVWRGSTIAIFKVLYGVEIVARLREFLPSIEIEFRHRRAPPRRDKLFHFVVVDRAKSAATRCGAVPRDVVGQLQIQLDREIHPVDIEMTGRRARRDMTPDDGDRGGAAGCSFTDFTERCVASCRRPSINRGGYRDAER